MAWNRFRADRALALLEVGLGRFDTAIALLAPLAEALEMRTRWPDPDEFVPADLVEALVRTDRRSEAAAAQECVDGFARTARRRWLAARAARCRGLLAPNGDYARHLIDALAWHEKVGERFEQARTHLCFGERLRRDGKRKDARQQLRAALANFEQLDAIPWAQRTRAELRASGETVPRPTIGVADQLTLQELQIALQVAEGKTNREVGAALFLSPKTVEFHLSRTYRKLGIRSRADLIRRFTEAESEPPAGRPAEASAAAGAEVEEAS